MKVNDTFVLNFVGLGLIVQNAENVKKVLRMFWQAKLYWINSKTLMNLVNSTLNSTLMEEKKLVIPLCFL